MFLTVSVSAVSTAQPNAARVRPSIDTFVVSRTVDGRDAPVDTLIQSLSVVQLSGAGALLQVYRQRDFRNGQLIDSLWMDPKSLLPIKHSRHSSQQNADVRFSHNHIVGRVSWFNGATQDIDTVVTGVIHDAAASDLVARALPLQAGDDTEMLFYVPGAGVYPMRILVSGVDTLKLRNVRRAAWRLTGHFGREELRLWVAKDNRDLLQLIAGNPSTPSMRYIRK